MSREERDRILHQTAELEEMAMGVMREVSAVTDIREGIAKDWTGDSAEVFLRKVSVLEEELTVISRGLAEEAEGLRQAVADKARSF